MKIINKFSQFYSTLSNNEKLTFISTIILPVLFFGYVQVQNFIKDDKIETLQYQLNALQFQPRLTIVNDPVFTNIENEPFKFSNKILQEYVTHDNDTVDLGLKIIIQRIHSKLYAVNSGKSKAKIIACVGTSKNSNIDYIRNIILNNYQDSINNYIKYFPPLFQDEILESSRDTVQIDFTHEIFSKDLSEDKSGILHYFILYQNELGQFFDTYFWLEISLGKIIVQLPIIQKGDSLLLDKSFKLPVRNVVISKESKPSYCFYNEEEAELIMSYISKLNY